MFGDGEDLMTRRTTRLLVAAFLLIAAAGVEGSTVAPPADLGHLARLSDAVVLARAETSWTEAAGNDALPWTATRFTRLQDVGAAATADTFVVREPGGVNGDRALAVGGAPAFRAGRTYLLFLSRDARDGWRSRMLSYGLLVEDRGLLVPMDESAALDLAPFAAFEPVGAYEKDALLRHLGDVARGAAWSRFLAGWQPMEGLVPPPAQCSFLADQTDGLRIRWFGYETGAAQSQMLHTTPGQTGLPDGGVAAVSEGIAAWTNHADSIIRYAYAGSQPRQTPNCQVGVQLGAVWFNDPCGQIPDLSNCSGTLAFGGVSYLLATQSYDGDAWHPVQAPYIVVNNGAQCIGVVTFKEMMTHELGHTQGFGHHAPTPAPDPTMSAFVKGDGRGAALVGADRPCASYAYHTFLDVPFNDANWRFIEAVENAGVTGGCAAGTYCPAAAVTREQMAVFLLKARLGPTFVPPPCATPPFADVPVSSGFCPWIRELAARSVTSGCGGGNYCPTAAVTREQMAVFLLRMRESPAYVPPACTAPMFNDVPCSSGFAAWINELVRRGITAGCGGGNYCPLQPNTRAQMAVFLAGMFGLPLPN
jgi:S-layer family protein